MHNIYTARALQVGARVRYTKVPDGARAKAQDVVQAVAHRWCIRLCTLLGMYAACTRRAHGICSLLSGSREPALRREPVWRRLWRAAALRSSPAVWLLRAAAVLGRAALPPRPAPRCARPLPAGLPTPRAARLPDPASWPAPWLRESPGRVRPACASQRLRGLCGLLAAFMSTSTAAWSSLTRGSAASRLSPHLHESRLHGRHCACVSVWCSRVRAGWYSITMCSYSLHGLPPIRSDTTIRFHARTTRTETCRVRHCHPHPTPPCSRCWPRRAKLSPRGGRRILLPQPVAPGLWFASSCLSSKLMRRLCWTRRVVMP